MKRLILLALLAMPAAFTACNDDKTGDTADKTVKVEQLEALNASGAVLKTIELPEANASAEFKIVVRPADATFRAEEICFKTDNGGEAQYVTFTLKHADGNTLTYTVADDGTFSGATPYVHKMTAVHTPTGIVSNSFTVTIVADGGDDGKGDGGNKESLKVSKVYIKLEDGFTRARDLDAKTSTIVGFREDGSAFETQYKNDYREWISATVRIEGADGLGDLEETGTKIKGRGNSTWSWNKKPYNLKLDSKAKVLGMKKHKRWCLIANALDRTHLRNWLAYAISRQMTFDYAVKGEFAELYFINEDGSQDYRGLYFLTEHIKEDADARVPLTEQKESATGLSGDDIGYLLEFDVNYDEPGRFLTTASRLPINIKYPAQEDWEDAGNMAQYKIYKDYISAYLNDVDRLITTLSEGGDSSELWSKLDVESMANFWIVFETMSCREILWPKSIYFHKDAGGKLKAGPTWDFDYRTLNASDAQQWINHRNATAANTTTQYWATKSGRTWWAQLIAKDKTFRDEVKRQWSSIYPKMQAIQQNELDRMYELLKEADERNATQWSQSSIGGNPNEDKSRSFEDAVKTLKNTFRTRTEWLNTQIGSWQ